MLFVITALDKEGAAETRAQIRPTHLEYLRTAGSALKLAGPLMGPRAERPVGSLFIVDFENAEAAKAWTDNDPYRKAGVFGRVSMRPFRVVAGKLG